MYTGTFYDVREYSRYKRKNVICIEGMEAREKLGENINTIRNLVVNPAHDRVLATTKQSQIYCAALLSSLNPGAAVSSLFIATLSLSRVFCPA